MKLWVSPSPDMTSILIHSAYVVTVNQTNDVFKNGAVFIEDNKISAVGDTDEVKKYASHAEFVLDGTNKVVLPGLINTHVHLAQALLRGFVPDYADGISWLRDYVWPLQGNMTPEEAKVSAELAILEMINTGTTSFLATSINGRYDVEKIIQTVFKSGMRSAIGRQMMDIPGYADKPQMLHPGLVEDPEESIKNFVQMFKSWNDKDGRIWIWISPRTPGGATDALYKRIADLVREYDSGVTMHLAEIKDDITYFKSRSTTPSKFVKDLGMIGPKYVFVHGVWLTQEDIEIFAQYGSSVSHNPCSNCKGANGIAPVVDMLKHKLNVSLGTDGGPSNDSYDLLREIKMMLLIQKVVHSDPAAMTLMEGIRVATINGARAIGQQKTIGSLESGKKADLAIFDLKNPHLRPKTITPLSNLIYAGSGTDASDVIIDGKFVKRLGKILTLDQDDILGRVDKMAFALRERMGLKPWINEN